MVQAQGKLHRLQGTLSCIEEGSNIVSICETQIHYPNICIILLYLWVRRHSFQTLHSQRQENSFHLPKTVYGLIFHTGITSRRHETSRFIRNILLLNLSRTTKEVVALGVPMKFLHIHLFATVFSGAQGRSIGFSSRYAVCYAGDSTD